MKFGLFLDYLEALQEIKPTHENKKQEKTTQEQRQEIPPRARKNFLRCGKSHIFLFQFFITNQFNNNIKQIKYLGYLGYLLGVFSKYLPKVFARYFPRICLNRSKLGVFSLFWYFLINYTYWGIFIKIRGIFKQK